MAERRGRLSGKVALVTGASQGLGSCRSDASTTSIKRHPASPVAKKCCEAIIDRRRELDLSPRIQKLATRARAFTPGLIDRVIYERVSTLRSAFTTEVEERQKVSQGAA